MSSKQFFGFCIIATMLCACHPKPEHTASSPVSNQVPLATQVPDENHPQCGDVVCQYAEKCIDNQCKTAFEMHVYLAPEPKTGDVKNDSYDYWECQSETCTYHADKDYSIPKGIRVREDQVYCGGDGIALSKLENHTCTNQGWVCSSPEGCDKCQAICHWDSCNEVTCSPGEKCDGGCKYVDGGLDGVFLCENGDCKCGSQRCGKNQICAYGDCYFAGTKRNGFADCSFSEHSTFFGTSDPPTQLIEYRCAKQCPSETAPKHPGAFTYQEFEIGDYLNLDIGLWTCEQESGCVCGDNPCPMGASCIEEQCVLYNSGDDDIDILNFHQCASEYPENLSYQPKESAHYQIEKTNGWPYYKYWTCDDSNQCICNGEKLPPNTLCHREKDGTEYIACIPDDYLYSLQKAPKKVENYQCKADRWVCTNDKCLCGNETLPKNAYCKDETIFCYGDEIPSNRTGYACSEEKKTWVCTAGSCLCGGTPLRQGATCKHWNNHEYQCCGGGCFTPSTASEHICVNGNWVVQSPKAQHHCNNKPLPSGARCEWRIDNGKFIEYAKCGKEYLFDWDDYRCENNSWKCASKDKTCVCNGKPLPDGARCNHGVAECGNTSLRDWDGFSCRDGKWVNNNPIADTRNDTRMVDSPKPSLCEGHVLGKDVICPDYLKRDSENGYDSTLNFSFDAEISMAKNESCEHVRGCLCHDKLCPPSGICSEQGCIDPLTDKPFASEDGFLISGDLRQCASPNGCPCGNTTIEYRDYCYQNEPYISMRTCVSNRKRTIVENNYLSYDCEYEELSWQNQCTPDPDVDPTQYLVRDCLISSPSFPSDRSVIHKEIHECRRAEGCQCIHNRCAFGEACYKGQCIADYPCHDVAELCR